MSSLPPNASGRPHRDWSDDFFIQLRNGQEDAWREAIRELLPVAQEALRARFGSNHYFNGDIENDAFDSAVRIVFHALHKRRVPLRNWDELAGYFIQVAFLNCLRKVTKRMNQPCWSDFSQPVAQGLEFKSSAELCQSQLPDERVLRWEWEHYLQEAIEETYAFLRAQNPKYVTIFSMKLDQRYTIDEIRKRVNCSVYLVRTGWNLAVRHLEKLLNDYLQEDVPPTLS